GSVRRGPLLLCLGLVLASDLAPALARAQARRTWGATPDAPPPVSTAPPEPPPSTIGTPLPGSTSAPSSPPVAEAAAPIVRTPGAIGLRYTLEGVEVRGNTTTLPRVVLRYVPFKAGDVLDVDDPELELTRFRLLGTGFFRDVQLSLRRGTQRGYVILV